MPTRPSRDRPVEEDGTGRQRQLHAVDEREGLADDLDQVDLGGGAVVAVEDRAARRRTPPRAPSGSGRRATPAGERIASTFWFTTSMKRPVSFDESSGASWPAVPKSTRPIWSLCSNEDVRQVRVAVEEAVAEDHRHPRLGHPVRELPALGHRVALLVDVARLRSSSSSRVSTRERVTPVDTRDHSVLVAGEVPVELLGVPGLDAVVELLPDQAGELVDDGDRVDELERAHALARDAGELVHGSRSASICRGALGR